MPVALDRAREKISELNRLEDRQPSFPVFCDFPSSPHWHVVRPHITEGEIARIFV